MPSSSESQSSTSSNAFSAFRRSYSQMSSFRQSSMSSFSQHAWTNSNSQSAPAAKSSGGSKQFVWKSESNQANSEIAQINGSSSNSQAPPAGGFAKRTKALRSASVPMESMNKGQKRPSSGTLFNALSSFRPAKKSKN